MDEMSIQDKMRIIQEIVPGRQITLAHIIANPDKILYQKLGLDPRVDYTGSAIGILTVSPAETAIITADIAMKSSGMIRPVDKMGRVVIPKEIRKTLRIKEGEPLEIYTDKDIEKAHWIQLLSKKDLLLYLATGPFFNPHGHSNTNILLRL